MLHMEPLVNFVGTQKKVSDFLVNDSRISNRALAMEDRAIACGVRNE